MRNFTTVIFVILLLLSTLGFAVDDGGTESVFSIGAGARAMGMGNAFVGLADDASAVYYNPSGLPYLPSQQISFLHTILFEETVYDYLSYVYPHNRSALGVAVMRLGTDDIGRRDREYYDLGRFSASQLQFMVSYSSRIKKNISAGLALKMAHHSIDNYSAYGFGLDASGHFKISKRISAGLLLQDIIGAKIQLISEKERTPFTFKAGLAYKLGHEFSTLRANLVFDADKPENRSLKIRTGFEVIHRNGLILRSGYDRDNFTLGMGIRYQDLIFDYAYKFIDHLSDSHRFSFTYNFGLSLEEREAIQTESNRRYSEHIIAENRRQSLLHELKKADRYYDRGVFDSSLTAYYRADAFADEKGYIQSRIDDIQSILSAQRSLPPAIIIDSSGTSFGVDFLGQAQRLYAQKSLISARDMVRIARKFDSASPELDSLDLA
ncbi:MAG: PorV/PorQ family protein, partial [candidate division Zixibacteria bacterium]|nr:PorV/PorQ family protein [candidate division Zixibacteria bacterium]